MAFGRSRSLASPAAKPRRRARSSGRFSRKKGGSRRGQRFNDSFEDSFEDDDERGAYRRRSRRQHRETPTPQWRNSLSPTRSQRKRERRGSREYGDPSPRQLSRSLDDDIIAFLNSSPRHNERAGGGFDDKVTAILQNSRGAPPGDDSGGDDHDGGVGEDSFLKEIRDEDARLFPEDESQFQVGSEAGQADPAWYSPKRSAKRIHFADEVLTASPTHTIYSTGSARKDDPRRGENPVQRKKSGAVQKRKGSSASASRIYGTTKPHRRPKKAPGASSRLFAPTASSANMSRRSQRGGGAPRARPPRRAAAKRKKKTKRKKKKTGSRVASTSEVILDRSLAPKLPPSPSRLVNAKETIKAWSKEEVTSTKPKNKFSSLERPSSAGARLVHSFSGGSVTEARANKLNSKVKLQKKKLNTFKLRLSGSEGAIEALQKQIRARDLHIAELRAMVKKRERALVVSKNAQATDAANTSGLLNLSTDSIRSVGSTKSSASTSMRNRKEQTKLGKQLKETQRQMKEFRRRETRAVEIHGALRATIDKMRKGKDDLGDQVDELTATVRNLKRSLEAERKYNKELIRTNMGESENLKLQANNTGASNRILRQEVSRLKASLDITRSAVKSKNHELERLRKEVEKYKHENGNLYVQVKTATMKRRLDDLKKGGSEDDDDSDDYGTLGDSGPVAKPAASRFADSSDSSDEEEDDKPTFRTIAPIVETGVLEAAKADIAMSTARFNRVKSMYERMQGKGKNKSGNNGISREEGITNLSPAMGTEVML